jgi:short-subunit dehydrogenase
VNEARPVALITGASAGIGAALARAFAAGGHELVLVARRGPSLAALADELAGQGHKRPLVVAVDLAAADAVRRIAEAMREAAVEPSVVVNNAGFGLAGAAAGGNLAEQLAMVDVNVRSLTELSLAFVPSLVRHRGGILNVASLGGFLPGPGMAVYYASKAYVISFSEALHRELKPRGVRVTVLCPGPVPTEFQARAGLRPDRGGALSMSAEAVARIGYRGFMQGRRMVVPGLLNKTVTLLPRLLPRAAVLRLIGSRRRAH